MLPDPFSDFPSPATSAAGWAPGVLRLRGQHVANEPGYVEPIPGREPSHRTPAATDPFADREEGARDGDAAGGGPGGVLRRRGLQAAPYSGTRAQGESRSSAGKARTSPSSPQASSQPPS